MPNWRPSTSAALIKARAKLYQSIRTFFTERNVLEVDTPLLCQYGVTDIHIDCIRAKLHGNTFFLQTSPEYAMKRLLAADIGAIYQICKAFRVDDCAEQHNPEFTLLEWYQPGFDHHQLMDEMDVFLQTVADTNSANRLSYEALFLQTLQFNPLDSTREQCLQRIQQSGIQLSETACDISKDSALQILMSYLIEPQLGQNNTPTFVYNFPSSQAALAKISREDKRVAERFEVYFNGMELANGFHELTDAAQQQQRFLQDQHYRKQHNLTQMDIDPKFIAALQHGLPNSAGIAVGIDRLLMAITKAKKISDVLFT